MAIAFGHNRLPWQLKLHQQDREVGLRRLALTCAGRLCAFVAVNSSAGCEHDFKCDYPIVCLCIQPLTAWLCESLARITIACKCLFVTRSLPNGSISSIFGL